MPGLEILTSIIPMSVGGVIALLIQIVMMWLIILLSDEVIGHQIEAKRALILAAIAYFASPLILAFLPLSIPYAGLLMPLVVWIVLGEVLLRAYGTTNRLKIAVLAFVIFTILNFLGIPGLIAAAIAF